MASIGDITVAENGQGNVKIHPYFITMVRWCVSCLWGTATVLLHRLMRAQVPQIAASKTLRAASTDHLHPEPKVECVVLHEPSSPTLDVIFVHGLYGSLGNTWRQGDWRTKYRLDPNVVQLRNHPSKDACDCHKLNSKSDISKTNSDNESKCEINEDNLIYDMNDESEIKYENINERLKRIIPNERSLITENFYNDTLLNNDDEDEGINENYKTQAKFVQDLFNKSKIYDSDVKYNDNNKCKRVVNECKCKTNEKRCEVGCGCVCDDCYSTCWPKDWIKMDFPGARVISINYTSDPYLWRPLWVKGNERLRLHERAEQMMSQLLGLGVGKIPIIWVGHSKGGLFIKQIYCEAFEAHLKLSKISNNETVNSNSNKSNVNWTNQCMNNIKNIDDKNKVIEEINIKVNKDFNKGILLKINSQNENDYRIDFDCDSDQRRYVLEENNALLNINKDSFNKIFDVINTSCNNDNGLHDNCDKDLKVDNENKIVYRNQLAGEIASQEFASLNDKEVELLKNMSGLWRCSAGFMFYSVPHRGSPLADIKTPITSRSIELLEISKDCPLVLSLQDRWLVASSPSKPVVRSLVETCRTLMSVLWLRIVSVDSADAGVGELRGVSLDHREICKPSSRSCLLYTQLKDLIHTALNKCQCR